jgi:homoserine O-acetyltransferase
LPQYNVKKGSVLLGKPLTLESGDVLGNVTIAYETYGELNANRSNVVFVAHALTGSASANEWWKTLIGEGKALDPNEYFIICANCIGSCYGSTGPSSDGTFPQITVRDIANGTFALLDAIGIDSLSLAIGGSFGGMIVFEMALIAPERVKRIAPLSCGVEHTPWRIAFSSAIRKIIEEGIRNGNTERAFALARQVAMTSYRSSGEFDNRFARKKNSDKKFEVESYLEHQGEKMVGRFSPYSYITLTKAMELYSVFDGRDGTRQEVLRRIQQPTLLLGSTTDILYPESELRSLSQELPNAEYHSIDAAWGHDSFLIEEEQINNIVKQFLEKTL